MQTQFLGVVVVVVVVVVFGVVISNDVVGAKVGVGLQLQLHGLQGNLKQMKLSIKDSLILKI